MKKLALALLFIPFAFAQENSIAIEGPGIKAQILQITPRDCTPPYALIGGHAEFKRFIQTACGISLKAALLQAGFVPIPKPVKPS